MISSSHNNKEIFGFLERFFFFVFYHEELRHPYIQTVCYVLFPYVNTSNVICCIVCCFTKGGSVSPMYDNWYTSALSRILRQDLGTSCDSEGGWGVRGFGRNEMMLREREQIIVESLMSSAYVCTFFYLRLGNALDHQSY